MKKLIFLLFLYFLLFLIPLVNADSTFFNNENDVFIMAKSPTPPRTENGITSETKGGGCRYKWNCTDWTRCFSDGRQIRNCTNIGSCSNSYKTPQIEQNCTYIISKIIDEKSKKLEEENVTEENEGFLKEQEKESQQRISIIFPFIAISIGIILIGSICYYFIKRLKKSKLLYGRSGKKLYK